MKLFFVVCFVLFSFAVSAVEGDKASDIKYFLETSQYGAQAKVLYQGLSAPLKLQLTEEQFVEQYINQLIPVFDAKFEHTDIKALISFYGTSFGRDMDALTVDIAKEQIKLLNQLTQ